MNFSKGQKIWSIIAAVVAVSAVGIYVFKPGLKKKSISAPPPEPAKQDLSSDGQRIQSVTTKTTNVNLRSSPSSQTNSNIVAKVTENGKYIGNVIEYVNDQDGGDISWVHVDPRSPFTVLTSPFYVRADLITAS